MGGAKIRLSEKELELVTSAEVILTKNAIIEKVKKLLAGLQHMQEQVNTGYIHLFAPEVLASGSKISRGENYRGLPYMILDQPRYFDKEDILAIRTMFWWGKHFSITLHLAGKYRELYKLALINAFDTVVTHDLFIGIHHDQWEHHFEKDNYTAARDLSKKEWGEIIGRQKFLKLAKKIPLTQWDNADNILLAEYTMLVSLLAGQLPSR